MPPALDWLDMTQPPPPRAQRQLTQAPEGCVMLPANVKIVPVQGLPCTARYLRKPDSRHSECTALSPAELAIVGICLFGLIYIIELLVEAASR